MKIPSGLPLVTTNDVDDIYTIRSNNWYTLRPYAFKFHKRLDFTDSNAVTIFLPINPSNITVTTHFATNIVTTLYGVVEEHSEIRYYDIVIQGTTGYAPRYVKPDGIKFAALSTELANLNPFKKDEIGRSSFDDGSGIAESLGLFKQTLGTINTVVQSAKGIMNVFGGDNDVGGVDVEKSGYVAFHNLYRMLHIYKKEASGQNGFNDNFNKVSKHPLTFVNYKDNVQYDCVPRTFTLVRSAESPMLYNYTIVMRAFNMKTISSLFKLEDTNKLAELGLKNAGPSIAYKMRDICSNATSAVAGITSLGRSGGA